MPTMHFDLLAYVQWLTWASGLVRSRKLPLSEMANLAATVYIMRLRINRNMWRVTDETLGNLSMCEAFMEREVSKPDSHPVPFRANQH